MIVALKVRVLKQPKLLLKKTHCPLFLKFNLRLANPAFFGVELDILAAAPYVHLAVVVEKLFLDFTEDDDVIEVALN